MEVTMPNSIGNKGPINALFGRMDRNADGAVDGKEVKKHLKVVGAPSGLFGVYHTTASDKFIETLDANNDKKVTWNEFQGAAKTLLPESMRNANGDVDPALADTAFAIADADADGEVTANELETATLDALPAGASFRGVTAQIAAKLGLDALDSDRSGSVSAAELKAAATEAADLLNSGGDPPEEIASTERLSLATPSESGR
jgi:Ca2+-binding EF-hand superfamily protein